MYCLHYLLIVFIIWYIVYLVCEGHGNILLYYSGNVLPTEAAHKVLRVITLLLLMLLLLNKLPSFIYIKYLCQGRVPT